MRTAPRRWSNLNRKRVTVEVGVGRSVNAFDVFDGFGGALVAGGLELALAVGPVAALVDLRC